MVHSKKLFVSSSVKYWTVSEDLTWSDLFPYVVRENEELQQIIQNL